MADVPNITQNFGRPSYRPEAPTGGLDPDMRRMAIVAVGFGGLLALGIGAFSLSPRLQHGVPVIDAQAGPVRIKPIDAGGMKVAGAEEIASGAEQLAPAPEKPALHALHAKSHAAARVAEAPPAAEPAAAPAAPAPVIAPAPPVQHASATALVPLSEPSNTAVQLAAFESVQAAQQDWGKMAERMPGLFDGHRPEVERASLSGRTIYRLRTGGFANIAAATDFCGKVRAKGGDCSIAAF